MSSLDKPGRKKWSGPEKWQVILAASSLGVAVSLWWDSSLSSSELPPEDAARTGSFMRRARSDGQFSCSEPGRQTLDRARHLSEGRVLVPAGAGRLVPRPVPPRPWAYPATGGGHGEMPSCAAPVPVRPPGARRRGEFRNAPNSPVI